jgi:predicted kinase
LTDPAHSGPPVLILTGPPGVGKTTTAAILAERSARAVHIESDAFFRFIRSGHVEPWKPESGEQNRVVMGVVAAAAAGYAAAGYTTIVDGIVIPRFFLEPLRSSLRDAGQQVAYAVLRAPLSVCLARVRARKGALLGEPGVVERLWHDFSQLGELERNVLDIGEAGPEGAADLLEQGLAAGLLAV